jgi:hypothetical protein
MDERMGCRIWFKPDAAILAKYALVLADLSWEE